MQENHIELPEQGFATVSLLTGTKARVVSSSQTDAITLVFGSQVRIPLSPDSWAVIIPELVTALPDKLRDDVANAICAAAGEVAS